MGPDRAPAWEMTKSAENADERRQWIVNADDWLAVGPGTRRHDRGGGVRMMQLLEMLLVREGDVAGPGLVERARRCHRSVSVADDLATHQLRQLTQRHAHGHVLSSARSYRACGR